MTGIKETLDVFAAFEALVVAYKEAMQDGKITFFDAKYLAEPVLAFKEALIGLKEIPAELADLDAGEWGQLIEAGAELGKAALEASEVMGME